MKEYMEMLYGGKKD